MSEVSLVGITKPLVEGVNTPGEFIAYCARVSNPNNQLNAGTASKLLRYCVEHQHWSIFEMVSATLEIKTTRDIGRQILRHRSFSFQEFSQRYAKVGEFAMREPRYQDKKNRQNSTDFEFGNTEDDALRAEWFKRLGDVLDAAQEAYGWALDAGIAKEQARVFLPEGLTMSRMYMTGSIRSWIHYIQLRSGNGTQKEHREIAVECGEVLTDAIPELFDIFAAPIEDLQDDVIPVNQNLWTLSEYNNMKLTGQVAVTFRIFGNGIACPECGTELYDTSPHVSYTSNPPQHAVHCAACKWQGLRY